VGGAVTPYLAAVYVAGLDAGARAAFAAWGLPLAGFRFAVVAGRIFRQAVPLAGAGARAPHPLLVRLGFALHPRLRGRRRRARQALGGRRWRAEIEEWRRDLAPRFREEALALQAVDPGALDAAALARHLAAATDLLRRGTELHFRLGVAWSYPVGDWLRRVAGWTGADRGAALAALAGSSPATLAALGPLRRLAAAVEAAPAAVAALDATAGPGRERLAALRASSPAVAVALDAALSELGERLVTGYDLSDWTLRELPNVLLRAVARCLDGRGAPGAPAAAAAADELRGAVPPAARAAYDEALGEARLAYGFRDEEVGTTYLWPAGLLRRALVAAGERGAAGGWLADPEHVFEATPAEAGALLAAAGGAAEPARDRAPGGDELAARAAERRRLAGLEVPARLGDPEPPLPLGALPAACGRLAAGVWSYLAMTDADGDGAPGRASAGGGGRLVGQGVGGGKYEGPARLVGGPADFERVAPGDVLVAATTSPAYNVLLPIVGAVVTDRGGLLCHTAIVAREFGTPGVVGTGEATRRVPDGARLLVDGDRGTVELRAAEGGR
jgi:pyruvate,water dikinase